MVEIAWAPCHYSTPELEETAENFKLDIARGLYNHIRILSLQPLRIHRDKAKLAICNPRRQQRLQAPDFVFADTHFQRNSYMCREWVKTGHSQAWGRGTRWIKSDWHPTPEWALSQNCGRPGNTLDPVTNLINTLQISWGGHYSLEHGYPLRHIDLVPIEGRHPYESFGYLRHELFPRCRFKEVTDRDQKANLMLCQLMAYWLDNTFSEHGERLATMSTEVGI